MEPPIDSVRMTAIAMLSGVGILGFLAVWFEIGRRVLLRLPILPLEPRRMVPWGVGDVLLVILVYLGGLVCVGAGARVVLGPEVVAPLSGKQPTAEPSGGSAEPSAEHPVTKLLAQDGSPAVFLLTALMAVGVAPVTEEILFRLVLQGWLQKMERQLRRRWVSLRWFLYPGLFSIGMASWLFAMMHFRTSSEMPPRNLLIYLLVVQMVVNIGTVVGACAWLRLRRGATFADLGVVPDRLGSDVLLGGLAFLAIGVPLYIFQYILTKIVPPNFAPDPIALFPFAVVLGLLYFRSGRIVPAVVLHTALNGTTMALLWLSLPK